MTNTYWNHNGKYQAAGDLLQALIPVEGEVQNHKKNPALEKYRNASNCYYDLYNNGLCNRASQFAGLFKLPSSRYKHGWDGKFREALYERTEEKMDLIILAAAIEQGYALHTVETI